MFTITKDNVKICLNSPWPKTGNNGSAKRLTKHLKQKATTL